MAGTWELVGIWSEKQEMRDWGRDFGDKTGAWLVFSSCFPLENRQNTELLSGGVLSGNTHWQRV